MDEGKFFTFSERNRRGRSMVCIHELRSAHPNVRILHRFCRWVSINEYYKIFNEEIITPLTNKDNATVLCIGRKMPIFVDLSFTLLSKRELAIGYLNWTSKVYSIRTFCCNNKTTILIKQYENRMMFDLSSWFPSSASSIHGNYVAANNSNVHWSRDFIHCFLL